MKIKVIICTISSLILLSISATNYACPVCERQQPKALQGIGHGVGPQDRLDYFIVGIAVLMVILTVFFSLAFLLRPGEKSQGHIKRFILN